MRAQHNKRKRTTAPTKGKGKEGNTTRDSRDWSDESNVEQSRRRFAVYEEALPHAKPAPRPPNENTKVWAKDVQSRMRARTARTTHTAH